MFKFIFQAILELLTTVFPVSANGHFSVISHLAGGMEFSRSLSNFTRFSLILPIIVIFRKNLLFIIKQFKTTDTNISEIRTNISIKKGTKNVVLFLLSATIIQTIVFFLLKGMATKITNNPGITGEGITFIVLGLIYHFADRKMPGEKEETDLEVYDFIIAGILSGLSILPGLSGVGLVLAYLIFRGFNKNFAFIISTILLIPNLLNFAIFSSSNATLTNELVPSTLQKIIIVLASIIFGFLFLRLYEWLITSDRLNVFRNYVLIIGMITIILGVVESVLNTSIYGFIKSVINMVA